MSEILHIVPGLNAGWSGIAVAAKLLAKEQGAELVDARNVDVRTLARFDEVWVHSTWSLPVWRACCLAKSAGKMLVRMTHGNLDPVRLSYNGFKKCLAGPVERYFLRQADVVVATCEAEADWIRAYEPKVKSIEITNLKRFFNLANTAAKKGQNFSPKPHPLHLLYLGRQHPLKGLSYLQEAWNTYYNICSSSHSSGNTQNIYYNMCSTELSTELRIVSNAFGDELKKVWDWCDVLVLPTLSDNFGLVIAEALERGKRVITTDGAPAWSPSASATEDNADGNDYGGRLTYINGYRDGSAVDRVCLLKEAIANLIGDK